MRDKVYMEMMKERDKIIVNMRKIKRIKMKEREKIIMGIRDKVIVKTMREREVKWK